MKTLSPFISSSSWVKMIQDKFWWSQVVLDELVCTYSSNHNPTYQVYVAKQRCNHEHTFPLPLFWIDLLTSNYINTHTHIHTRLLSTLTIGTICSTFDSTITTEKKVFDGSTSWRMMSSHRYEQVRFNCILPTGIHWCYVSLGQQISGTFFL